MYIRYIYIYIYIREMLRFKITGQLTLNIQLTLVNWNTWKVELFEKPC